MRSLIEEHRCATVEDVSAVTGACRGCQTCRPDIEALLREAAAKAEVPGTGWRGNPPGSPAPGSDPG